MEWLKSKSKPGYLHLVISDVHLNHMRVATKFIIDNIDKYLLNQDIVSRVDRVVIAGDLFDTVLSYPDKQVSEVELWMGSLLRRCKIGNTQLRILKGTPRHDRDQSAKFLFINREWGIDADVEYYDQVAIERDNISGMHFLYIPDEYRSTHSEVFTAVQAAMLEAGVSKVDYAYMHGFFEHQVPSTVDCHQSSWYLPIVENFIFHGHDHHSSVYKERILSQGSSDRLCFGEEEPKGCWLSFVSDKEKSLLFVVNEGAKIFKRYLLVGNNEEEWNTTLSDVANLPEDSFVEVTFTDKAIQQPFFKAFKKRYPDINWSEKTQNVTNEADLPTCFNSKMLEITPLNKNTLPNIFEQRLRSQNVSEDIIAQCLAKLSIALAEIKE